MTTHLRKSRFRKKYILGEGYCWFPGGEIQMYSELTGGKRLKLALPLEVESIAERTPKYRLILERVK